MRGTKQDIGQRAIRTPPTNSAAISARRSPLAQFLPGFLDGRSRGGVNYLLGCVFDRDECLEVRRGFEMALSRAPHINFGERSDRESSAERRTRPSDGNLLQFSPSCFVVMHQLGYEIEQALCCARAEDNAVVQLNFLRTGTHVPILVHTERQHHLFAGAAPTDNIAVGTFQRSGIHLYRCLGGCAAVPSFACAAASGSRAAASAFSLAMISVSSW